MDSPDNKDINGQEEAAPAPVKKPPRVGQLLREARLERGLSIDDVARQLRLSVRQVTALETDDYDNVASGTFLRGFVRNYAKLLQMDAAPLLQQLEEFLPPPPTQIISNPIEGIPFPSNQKSGRRNLIIAAAAVLALFLLIYEIYRGNEANVEKEPSVQSEAGIEAEPAMEPPQFQSSGAIPGGRADGMATAENTGTLEQKSSVSPSAQERAPLPSEQRVPPAEVVPPPANSVSPGPANPESANIAVAPGFVNNGGNGVHLIFEGESWTEIRDGGGRLLLSRINPRGTEQVVHGTPPYSLTIGNAAEVKLVYNNKPVDLAPFTNAYGGTARLSLK
ncbi:helix-turn-helix domain-containing protein [Nitrosospira briensis]|uniref:helix-turn-helix domain-containing protein n=1 Tax=Nitrosospira briensis TaxID=35799 RepID=UPI0008E8282A|nr:RodZ domain-containing protein [Nitrosospira briensis]SFO42000.1 cytoskeleton protein RodZ [Nitrosospira briensis]